MKLKEAPQLKGKKFRELYDNNVFPSGIEFNIALGVYPEHVSERGYRFNYKNEDEYVSQVSDMINSIDEVMAENSVIILSGFWGETDVPNKVSAVWKSMMSAIKTTDYAIGDVIVWKKGSKTKGERENSLDIICEPVFVLCRKSEYRTYHLNVDVQTIKGNAVYHTPQYNLITTNGRTAEEDYDQLKEYLIRMYCPDDGAIYYPLEDKV